MQCFNHLKNILGFLSEEGVNNFNDCFVDDNTPYNFEEAKRLYDEHLFNLLAEMKVDSDMDAIAELSTRLANKFYYHPDNKNKLVKSIRYDINTSYIPDQDITVIWQDMYVDNENVQHTLAGFYYGEPDDASTEQYSTMPLSAQFDW